MKSKLLRVFLWILALSILGVLLFSYFALKGQSRYAIQPNLTRIVIKGEGDDFLQTQDIISVLPLDITDTVPQPIRLADVEHALSEKIPYAREVNAFVSPTTHKMTIQVRSRKPILRYFSDSGSFFLDDEGKPMQTKPGVSVYVPVVRASQLDDESIEKILFPLAQFLQKHEEWRTFFSLIELNSPTQLHFYPRVGDYIFEVRGVEHLEEDLGKIKVFYDKIVPQVGSNRYQLIKLSYKGQIVCKRRP